MSRGVRLVLVFLLLFGALVPSSFAFDSAGYELQAILGHATGSEQLKAWSPKELQSLKQVSVQERDPRSGKPESWKGVLLSTLIENALSGVPADRKAQIDLVVLKNEAGGQAMIPRSFVTKFPVVLATTKEGLRSVLPITSKMKEEQLPLEKFFLPGIKEIELTNYHDRYGAYFLKRRTDPAAMRGEKIFVQTCLGCHTGGYGISIQDKSRSLASTSSHPVIPGFPQLSDRDRRAVVNYLDAYRSEN